MAETEVTEADFAHYFPSTPAALCVKECARLSSLRKERLGEPLLDVGCGDGVFANIAFQGLEAWGIDINEDETKLAEHSAAYSRVLTADVTEYELPQEYFQTCVANCSLEHIPRLDLALTNIYASLKPGGTLITYVPNRDWAEALLSYRCLSWLSKNLARKLQRSIDEFFRHEHLYDQEGWREFVAKAGFNIVKVEPVLSSATTVAFELLLLPSLIGFFNKKLTRRWTNFPALRRLLAAPAYQIVEGALGVGTRGPTAEFLSSPRNREASMPSEQPDYFSNHSLKLRFPWRLYHGPIIASLQKAVDASGGPEILNLGSGPFLELPLLNRIGRRFTACDIDARAVEEAKRRFGPELRSADVLIPGEALPYPDETFDLVTSMDVIEHIVDPVPWVKEALRVLKPNGRLFLTTPNYASLSLRVLEATALEFVARIQGFSRRDIHPTKMTPQRLEGFLREAGSTSIETEPVAYGWVLTASAGKT